MQAYLHSSPAVADVELARSVPTAGSSGMGWHPRVFDSIAEKVAKLAQCSLLPLRFTKPETQAKLLQGARRSGGSDDCGKGGES